LFVQANITPILIKRPNKITAMNLLQIQENLRATVITTAKNEFDVELENVASETPPKTELGDVAFPVAFELAKRIKQATGEKKNPREIAEKLKAAIENSEAVERVEVAGAGYLNVFFNRAKFLIETSNAAPLPKLNALETEPGQKVCVEHTSVNPNKAAHIGHVATRFSAIRSYGFCERTASRSRFSITLITPACRSPMSLSGLCI
jgi:arginyl-tRNA synthetase